MKDFFKKSFVIGTMITMTMLFLGCATATSSIKGTKTTVDTLGGDSLETIVLIDNMWESAKISKTDENSFIFYAKMNTNGNARPGSLIMYIDDNKNTIVRPMDWNIDDVSISNYVTVKHWSANSVISDELTTALKDSNKVVIRSINGNAYMGRSEGVDISTILPNIKQFIE